VLEIKHLHFWQVIPSQLETILKSHPGVEDAAVVGIKCEDCGELPMAYAMKKHGYDKLEATKLINFLHSALSYPTDSICYSYSLD
jgi:acyl-CoA synthetase (AMP-forming)/AMP-acid ligase II